MEFIDKKLILFDFDGTLIDSAPDLAAAVNHMLQTLDREVFSEAVIRGWIGNGAGTLVKRALSGSNTVDPAISEHLFKEALAIFLDFYADNLANESRLYEGVKETLETLQTNGYTLAIVTNKPYAFIQPILEGLLVDELFQFYIGGDSLVKKKPNPEPLLHTCTTLGFTIGESIMIGDSKNDILAAKAAPMHSIGVTYGYNYGEDIGIYGPDKVVDKFSDILHILKVS